MTLAVPQELQRRQEETTRRLRKLDAALRSFDVTEERHPWVTIYATGSLGRREIGEHSDLDVFVVDAASGPPAEGHVGNLHRLRLLSDLICSAQGADFPPFSRDGEFLQIHRLGDLIDHLGKPDEDHLNVFTARMLLVLESRCLVGTRAYERCVDTVLDRYWAEDSETHDFRPTILINDIVRYWKTLCLSYEGWRRSLARPLDPSGRIDLLKLKFNRLWLCFTGLGYLLLGDDAQSFTRAHARRLVELSPLDRVSRIAAAAGGGEPGAAELGPLLDAVVSRYAWWLERTAPAKHEQEAWIADVSAYRDASERARMFGDDMWRVVNALGDRAGLTRYLLV